MRPVTEDAELHLGRVSCLDLVVEPVELLLDAVLGGGVQHLGADAGCVRGPGAASALY